VVKKGGNKPLGCHPNRAAANKQLAALYASESKKGLEDDPEPVEEEQMEDKALGFVPFGVTSFAELAAAEATQEAAEAMWEASDQFNRIAQNIIYSDVEGKPELLRKLVTEYESKLSSLSGEVVSEVKAVDPLPDERSMWKSIVSAITRPFASKSAAVNQDGMMFWKEGNGRVKFFGIYSNNYRDDDRPREIISEKAHKTFARLAQDGAVPMPELWVWHIPGSRIGEATWVDYVDGMAVAAGYIDEGMEGKAMALKSMADSGMQIGMSHGMPVTSVLRSPEDETVIDFYRSREISVLPRPGAANKRTGFIVTKESKDMAKLTDDQRKFLHDMDFDDMSIEQIEGSISGMKQSADASGVDRKEAPALNKDEGEAAAAPTGDAEEAPTPVTREEIAAALQAVVTPLIDQLAALQAAMGSVNSEVKALKGAAAEVQKQVNLTPRASLAELATKTVFGSKEARVAPGSNLAKAAPEEAQEEDPQVTASSFLDALIQNSARVRQ